MRRDNRYKYVLKAIFRTCTRHTEIKFTFQMMMMLIWILVFCNEQWLNKRTIGAFFHMHTRYRDFDKRPLTNAFMCYCCCNSLLRCDNKNIHYDQHWTMKQNQKNDSSEIISVWARFLLCWSFSFHNELRLCCVRCGVWLLGEWSMIKMDWTSALCVCLSVHTCLNNNE